MAPEINGRNPWMEVLRFGVIAAMVVLIIAANNSKQTWPLLSMPVAMWVIAASYFYEKKKEAVAMYILAGLLFGIPVVLSMILVPKE